MARALHSARQVADKQHPSNAQRITENWIGIELGACYGLCFQVGPSIDYSATESSALECGRQRSVLAAESTN